MDHGNHPRHLMLLNDIVQLEADNLHNELRIARQGEDDRRRRTGRERRERRYWTRAWLLRRPELGQYERRMVELEQEDLAGYKNFMRMEPEMFQELLGRIETNDSFYRKAIPSGLKLAITLRHLATGDNYHSIMYKFRVAHTTISGIVRSVCEAIIEEYAHEVILWPTTQEEWHPVADQFGARWNFHHALSALDGKHVAIKCPDKAGSFYYNYKGYHSIVLMGLLDAD